MLREEQAQEGLRYQLEYVIGGKDSDKKNLEFVVKELLAVRRRPTWFIC